MYGSPCKKKSKWVWSGNTTITHCRPTHGTVRKSCSCSTLTKPDFDTCEQKRHRVICTSLYSLISAFVIPCMEIIKTELATCEILLFLQSCRLFWALYLVGILADRFSSNWCCNVAYLVGALYYDFYPLYTYGLFLLVWYNKIRIVHCTYLEVSGYN